MKRWIQASLLSSLLLLAACGAGNAAVEQGSAQGSGAPADSVSAGGPEQPAAENNGAFPMTVAPTVASVDSQESGAVAFESVTFDKAPERLVVFDFGFLDTLDALGVEGVVGLPKDSSLPAHLEKYAAGEYASVGTLKGPLLEDIAALRPDAIFISGRQAAFYEDLREIAPVVFVGTDQQDYWNTFLASVDIAARLFGKEAEAGEILAKFDDALARIRERAGQFETALVTMYNEGKLSGFATNSRFGYVYDVYGFKPVTNDINASSHGSDFGFEALLAFDPDVLFVIDRTAAVGGESNIRADLENDLIKKTKAYRNDRIIYLDGALWYLGGGGLVSELDKIEEVLEKLN